jgi:glycosyltransferase involved in cell wall biosynthesis
VRILFAQKDVIGKIGGGESASTRIFKRLPNISVTWPVSKQPTDQLAPNFECVLIDVPFRSALREQINAIPVHLRTLDHGDFYEAAVIAHAVRGRVFDIVECPDYLSYGRYLPFAFAEYGVKYNRLVCSLHGRSSRTLEIENEVNEIIAPTKLAQLYRAESQLISGSSDIRYGLSARYGKETAAIEGLPVTLIDPLCALPTISRSVAGNGQKRGEAWFVGRQDRLKGPDLFLASVFRAGQGLWDNYAMCGPSVRHGRHASLFEGMTYCRNRGMPFRYRGVLRFADISREVYAKGALVVIPSRKETFNLVAIEALLHGAPVLVSKHVGAVDFIRDRFGGDFGGAVEFDPTNELEAASALRNMWDQWDEHHEAVIRAIDEIDLTPKPESLLAAYDSEPQFNAVLREEAFCSWDRIVRDLFLRHPTVALSPDSSATCGKVSYINLKSSHPPSSEKPVGPRICFNALTGRGLFKLAENILGDPPEANMLVAVQQARRLATVSSHINRAKIFRYLADCEDTARPEVSLAYRLRVLRMLGFSSSERTSLIEKLQTLGFSEEAVCLDLWPRHDLDPSNPVTRYLEERRKWFMRVRLDKAEYVIDRRHAVIPKVTIIVSMYCAPRSVIDNFVAHLSHVAMVRNHKAEVVFVDSGSPEQQKDLLEAIPTTSAISYVIVRSIQRETIQTAWNRGLQISRGEYITCLGVDEGITEHSLDELAQYLDKHSEVDWVTGDSVATEVDARGQWKRDVICYSRTPYTRYANFTDCTYINYVGGLYRRSIHDRFGWYDGSFKGAGDTEFKNRIFPFIKTAVIPKTFGFFFNFPAPRVTSSANIEVEDLRAWYIFRTRGGIEYFMREQDIQDWEELFWTALSGHRCWTKIAAECDLTFGANILNGLLARRPNHPLRVLAKSLHSIVREMRLLQDWSGRPAWLGTITEADLIERSRRFFRKCKKHQPQVIFPQDFRADALFFAHSWTW